MDRQEIPCESCGEDITPDSDFCPHCGVLRVGGAGVLCAVHEGVKATHVCIICHRPLCARCRKKRQGKYFCSDHKKVEVVFDWACVFRSDDPARAELFRSVLEGGGFNVQKQNRDSGGVWGTALASPAAVFVPIPEYFAALEALEQWQHAPELPEDDPEDAPRRREIKPDDR